MTEQNTKISLFVEKGMQVHRGSESLRTQTQSKSQNSEFKLGLSDLQLDSLPIQRTKKLAWQTYKTDVNFTLK